MTREQARQILLLYRPWVKTPPDPEMAEALAFARQDAELRSWLEAHCELQQAVRDSFRSQSPPEALREQIVSECLARRRAVTRRAWFAAATAVLLAAVGFEAYLLFGDREGEEEISFAAYERRMSRDALRLYRMDIETDDLDKIRSFLSERKLPANYVLPSGLRSAKATGCLATAWQGRPVSMICFHTGKPLPPGRSSDLFLFVIAQDKLPDPPTEIAPSFAQVNRLAVARWSADGNTYLLATEQGVEELKKLL